MLSIDLYINHVVRDWLQMDIMAYIHSIVVCCILIDCGHYDKEAKMHDTGNDVDGR
jgi:hypothetical protein